MKNSMTPAGIEPATFRFVAQHLNHRAITGIAKKPGNRAHHSPPHSAEDKQALISPSIPHKFSQCGQLSTYESVVCVFVYVGK